MAQIIVCTEYGQLTVSDCMVEDEFGNLNDGVEIFDYEKQLLCEVSGVSTEDIENMEDVEAEMYVNSLIENLFKLESTPKPKC